MGTLTTELMTQRRTQQAPQHGLTWTQTWSVWTRSSTTPEDSWVPSVCLFCSVSLVSSSFDSLHITLWLKIRVCASFIMHTLIDFSLSLHPLHFPSLHHLSASSTSFCSSLSLRLSRQQPCALLRSRVPQDYNFSSTWSTPTSFQQTLITFHQIQRILVPVLCCIPLRTMRQQSKWTLKADCPTMRHVSRTHRVTLVRLFDRINLDPKIQIRHIDTKHQLADMLTGGNFTRDEWNNLLHLLNISHFSSICCTMNFSLISCSTVAKRTQDQKEEERVVSKSRPAAMNLSSLLRQVPPPYSSPIASKIPGMPIASEKTRQQDEFKFIRRSVDFSIATEGCIPWRVNGKAAVKPVASRRRRFRRLRQSWGWGLVLQRGTCCQKHKSLGATSCTRSQFFRWQGKSKGYRSDMEPPLPNIAEHIPLCGRRLLFGQENLWKTTWRSYERFECEFDCLGNFMNTSLRAAVHLGKHCYFWKTTGQLFRDTEKLISGQTETTGMSLINFQDWRWVSTSLLHSPAYQYSTVKVNVFSDSVLCLGKWRDNPLESWKKQVQWYSDNNYLNELNRIDGQPMEFEWNIFPGFNTEGILNQIQQMMGESQCEPENFTGRIIFMWWTSTSVMCLSAILPFRCFLADALCSWRDGSVLSRFLLRKHCRVGTFIRIDFLFPCCCAAHSLCPIQTRWMLTRSCIFVAWLKPLHSSQLEPHISSLTGHWDTRARPYQASDDSLVAAMFLLMPKSQEETVMFANEDEGFQELFDRLLVAYSSTKQSIKMSEIKRQNRLWKRRLPSASDVFTKKTRTIYVCPAPSVFLCRFISVCLGFPLCVVFFVFFCSLFPAIPPGSPSAPPTSMVLDIVEGQGRGRGAKKAKIQYGVKPDIFEYAENVFAGPVASSSAPYPQELKPWSSGMSEPIHSSTAEKSEKQTPVPRSEMPVWTVSQKFCHPLWGRLCQRIMGADQQRLQISDLHFDKFLTPATFACWKIRFKTEVWTCSQFPAEAMHWIKEVETVDSVDYIKISSVRRIRMPDFEVLDAKIASALNRIIHNIQFKRRVSLEEQKAPHEINKRAKNDIAESVSEFFHAAGWKKSVENPKSQRKEPQW